MTEQSEPRSELLVEIAAPAGGHVTVRGDVSSMRSREAGHAIRAIMLDVDGVLIHHPHPSGWTVHLQRDLDLSPDLFQAMFFDAHWADIVNGRVSMRERLAPVLADIAPHISCAQFIDYWFAADLHVNQSLLAEVAKLRAGGLPVHLATVQEHERARFLWDGLDFRSHFDAIHYAADLGAAKPNPAFFARIEQRTGFAPAELFFVDDRPHNVAAAQRRGWHAAHWSGEQSLQALLPAANIQP